MPLEVAIRECFPYGGATVSTLRTEARKGRLAIERIGGRDYVTRAAIEEMRKLCRVQARAHDYTSIGERAESPSMSSEMEYTRRAQAAAVAISERLKKRSRNISNEPSDRIPANVISLKSDVPKS
jgi:hypothetical protein